MIKREKQKIISGFGWRTRNGKKEFHRGLDLRSWNKRLWKRQPIIFPERCIVIRRWRDWWGTGIAYRGLLSGYLFKSMHIKINKNIIDNAVYQAGEIIGYSDKVHKMPEHEHFEVLKKDTAGHSKEYLSGNVDEFWIDPIIYFEENDTKYE